MPTGVLVSGALFSLSLIVAIGAQNAYVLRQGVLRSHVGTVVLICAASDVVLIAAGVAGVGAVVVRQPGLLILVRDAGSTLLLAYAVIAARRAVRAAAQSAPDARSAGPTRRGVVAATLGFTWLNPAVYLDTLVLLGTVASAHPAARWWFATGAAAASVGWFIGLGFGARLLAPLLGHPRAWRLLDAFVAVVMTITALRMLSF